MTQKKLSNFYFDRYNANRKNDSDRVIDGD